jgi:hypothetical protein
MVFSWSPESVLQIGMLRLTPTLLAPNPTECQAWIRRYGMLASVRRQRSPKVHLHHRHPRLRLGGLADWISASSAPRPRVSSSGLQLRLVSGPRQRLLSGGFQLRVVSGSAAPTLRRHNLAGMLLVVFKNSPFSRHMRVHHYMSTVCATFSDFVFRV